MAEIRAFRALEYDRERVPLEKVVTQPYDKITAQMRERYLAAHPNNLVRVLRPLDQPEPSPSPLSPYERAAETLKAWRRDGLIREIEQPALFAYYQRFRSPETGATLTRKGFIGLLRLEDYANGVVFPHERTLSGPREDRLELLRHTRTHFGLVFLMYSDSGARVESILDRAIETGTPATVRDEYDVDHLLWRISAPATTTAIRREMSGHRLLIADGHHRYETALAFRDEQRRVSGPGDAAGFEWIMAAFVNMESPAVTLLPTHRVVSNLTDFDPRLLVERAARFFDILDVGGPGALVPELRARRGAPTPALGLVLPGGRTALLALRAGTDLRAHLPDLSPPQAALSVVLLHRLVLERCLGLTEDDIRSERHIRYVRDADEAISDVQEGRAQACFLLNPTPLGQVRDLAFSGEVLPQKSTDFYPKLLSGLVMYSVS